MKKTKEILVYGSKDFGVIVKDLVKQVGYKFSGFIDDFNRGKEIIGTFNDLQKYSPNNYKIVIGIGYNNFSARWSIYKKILKAGYKVATLIHPKAYVRDKKSVDNGAIIMAGAIIDFNTQIGKLAVIWPGVVASHDSIIGDNTFLSPNSTICGFVKIGNSCFVGAGSVIVDHLEVPSKTFIKAGRVYTKLSSQDPDIIKRIK